jgi:hypothetical protein
MGGLAAVLCEDARYSFTLVIGALCGQAILVPPDKRSNLVTVRSFLACIG